MPRCATAKPTEQHLSELQALFLSAFVMLVARRSCLARCIHNSCIRRFRTETLFLVTVKRLHRVTFTRHSFPSMGWVELADYF